MKKMLIATALLCASVAHAAPMTSDITIPVPGTGVVSPKGSILVVPLTALYPNVQYRVECKVTNPNSTGVGMVFAFTDDGNFSTTGDFKLNNQTITTGQGMLTPTYQNDVMSPNLAFRDTSAQNALTFENTDDTNSVTVSNCVAHFVVGK